MGGSASSPAFSSSSSSSSSISSSCGASCGFMAMTVMPPAPAIPPPPPPPSPPSAETHDYWKRDSTSVSAVSFGFVATAVLISLFLIVAIFERFLRRPPAGAEADASHIDGGGSGSGNNSNNSSNNTNSSNSSNPDRGHSVGFRFFPSLKGHSEPRFEKQHTVEISVLMPGQRVPTFIANPVPIPCSREGISNARYGDGSTATCSFNCARSICNHLSGKPSEVSGTATI